MVGSAIGRGSRSCRTDAEDDAARLRVDLHPFHQGANAGAAGLKVGLVPPFSHLRGKQLQASQPEAEFLLHR
jgi:hypothetical protein